MCFKLQIGDWMRPYTGHLYQVKSGHLTGNTNITDSALLYRQINCGSSKTVRKKTKHSTYLMMEPIPSYFIDASKSYSGSI